MTRNDHAHPIIRDYVKVASPQAPAMPAPGPWVTCDTGFAVLDANFYPVAATWFVGSNGTRAVAAANAQFIATAPDMLAGLRQCGTELEEAANIFRPQLPGLANIYDKAAERTRALVAKAEGRS